VGECNLLLHFFLQEGVEDKWDLRLDPSKRHTIRRVYHSMSSMVQIESLVFCDIVWNKEAHLKVSLFVWRWFYNRLHTKENMVYHGIIL